MPYPTFRAARGLTLEWHPGYARLPSVMLWRWRGWLITVLDASSA